MGSHRTEDHEARKEFLQEMRLRAEIMSDLGKNRMTTEGKVIRKWKEGGITVAELPADMSGVLRISIGGGPDTPVPGDYCNFRGDQGKCIALLERAIKAMQAMCGEEISDE
jgi:hypothetical protein